MEKQPTDEELDAARAQARADAEEKVRRERGRPAVDQPVVEEQAAASFAPEALRAEYERVYEETLAALRARSR